MVKPPVVYTAGLLRRIGAGIDTDDLGLARPDRRPAALLPAERRRLGLHALAQHRDLPRPLVRIAPIAAEPPAHTRAIRRRAPTDAARSSDARLAFWGNPPLSRGHARRLLARSPTARSATRSADWEKQAYPPLVENALRQLIARLPRPPDRMTRLLHCNRSEFSAARVAEAGAGCRRSSRACRSPAGTGLTRRGFLARSPGSR